MTLNDFRPGLSPTIKIERSFKVELHLKKANIVDPGLATVEQHAMLLLCQGEDCFDIALISHGQKLTVDRERRRGLLDSFQRQESPKE